MALTALGLSPACGDKAETDDDDGQAGSSNQDQLDALEEKLDQLGDRLEDQEAELEAAKKAREAAERALAAAQEALENAASPEEIEAARKALEDAQAAFDRAQEDLEAAQADIDKLKDELDDAKEQLGRGPLYAMTLRVWTIGAEDLGTSYYLVTTPTLDEGTVLSPDQGIERVGRTVYGIDGYPAIWFEDPDDTAPTMERWDLRGNDFVPPNLERTVSFGNLSNEFVNYAFGALISPQFGLVAYNDLTEIVRWNPTTMEILGTLSINDSDLNVQDVRRIKRRPNGTIVASGFHLTYEEVGSEPSPRSFGAVVLNATATEIIDRDVWDDEGEGYSAGVAPDGTSYFTFNPTNSAGEFQETCLLRMLPEATEFDRDYGCKPIVDLVQGARTDGLESGGFEMVGDHALITLGHQDTERGYLSRYYTWDPASGGTQRLGGAQEFDLSFAWGHIVDGRYIFSENRALAETFDCMYCEGTPEECSDLCEASSSIGTTFFEITKDDIKPAFTVPKAVEMSGIVRVR